MEDWGNKQELGAKGLSISNKINEDGGILQFNKRGGGNLCKEGGKYEKIISET